METLRVWLRNATKEERRALAAAAGTSETYLYCIAAEEGAKHKRYATSELAIAIEKAARPITATSEGRLPEVLRVDVSATCRECEFAQKCLGAKAVAADFKHLGEEHY